MRNLSKGKRLILRSESFSKSADQLLKFAATLRYDNKIGKAISLEERAEKLRLKSYDCFVKLQQMKNDGLFSQTDIDALKDFYGCQDLFEEE